MISPKSATYLRTILLVASVVTVLAAGHLCINGTDEAAVRIIIRWTAKIAACCFILAFGAASFHYFFPSSFSAWLLCYRPHFGLAFGVVHTYHLLFLLWLQRSIHPVFTLAKKTSLLGGGLAYLLMFLMVLTTFPRFRDKLTSGQWKTLHLLGGYWIWLIFFRSYTRQVINQGRGYVIFSLLTIVLLLRLAQFYSQRQQKRKAASGVIN